LARLIFRLTCKNMHDVATCATATSGRYSTSASPPWLEGLDDGVVGRVEMLYGMLIFRGIAAANMPAFQTDTQVNPAIPRLQTILTPLRARRDIVYMVKMRTLLCH